MGIQDRDYYRESTRGFRVLGERMHVCLGLTAVFVIVFFLQFATHDVVRDGPFNSGYFTDTLELDTSKVFAGEVWRVFTSPFLHKFGLSGNLSTVFPIFLTIVFLLWLGKHVEDIYGSWEFLGYCLLTAFLGSIALVVGAGITQHPIKHVGPSGMIAAILVLYALHYRHRTINLFLIIPTPIWVFPAFYAMLDVVGFMDRTVHPELLFAHFFCAGFALLYYHYSLRVSNWIPSFQRAHASRRSGPRTQLFTETPSPEPVAEAVAPVQRSKTPRPSPASAEIAGDASDDKWDEQLEAQMDAVLEKMNKYGRESLTEEEWAILRRASEVCQKRRRQLG